MQPPTEMTAMSRSVLNQNEGPSSFSRFFLFAHAFVTKADWWHFISPYVLGSSHQKQPAQPEQILASVTNPHVFPRSEGWHSRPFAEQSKPLGRHDLSIGQYTQWGWYWASHVAHWPQLPPSSSGTVELLSTSSARATDATAARRGIGLLLQRELC